MDIDGDDGYIDTNGNGSDETDGDGEVDATDDDYGEKR